MLAGDNDHGLPRRDPPLPNVGDVKARAAAAALAPHGVTLPVAAMAQAARQDVQQADRDAARQRPQQRPQTPAQDGASEAHRQAPELRPRGPRM